MNSEFLLSLLNQSRKDGFRLVCVTKNRSVDEINEALDLGVIDIGENRVQEAKCKFLNINKKCRKHLIGHLQTNKVKDAVSLFDYIHSVDSVRLAQKISKECLRQNKVMKFFLQINASEEKSKSGFSPLLVLDEVRLISQLPAIELIGLMTIASITGSPVTTFRKLKKLSEEMGLKELSMGMSADYLIALEEGATFLRIGSSIFDI